MSKRGCSREAKWTTQYSVLPYRGAPQYPPLELEHLLGDLVVVDKDLEEDMSLHIFYLHKPQKTELSIALSIA